MNLKYKLKTAIIIVTTTCFTSACSVTPVMMPVEKDDKQVTLVLDRNYVLKNSSYDYYPGRFFPPPNVHGGGAGAIVAVAAIALVEVGLFAVYTPLKLIGNSIQGTHITVQPDGYDERYSQEVAFGKNIVWLPNNFLQTGGLLSFTVLGDRQGMWTEKYEPIEKQEGAIILQPGTLQTSRNGE
jgi:hypothetical protein